VKKKTQSDVVSALKEIAKATKGRIDSVAVLPDGSGFATMSMPLPKDHWLTKKGNNVPPMPFGIGQCNFPKMKMNRRQWASAIRDAGKFAIRAATDNGKIIDFDPDALLQNLVIGMIGYDTSNRLSCVDPEQNSKGKKVRA